MTRKEEIEKAAEQASIDFFGYSESDFEVPFQKGAEWADKTMINKALEWMKKEIRPYYSELKYKYDDFVKAMEE